MMHGIDISNWQRGLTIPSNVDFVIAKATEGLTFVDKCCDGFIQQAIKNGKLFGFYHFARNNEPEKEACYFAENTVGYRNKGIPVLDIEDSSITDWGSWAQRFVDKYHAITGVYPMIYCSAAYLTRFYGFPLVEKCGLWIAGYPSTKALHLKDVPKFIYNVSPWKFAAIWQFSSNGWLDNWDEPVDLNVAYMDANSWSLYATGDNDKDSGATQVLPNPASKTWHFEQDGLAIDVSLV